MGSLDKFSEAIAIVGHKKDAIENVTRLMMREWEGVEKNSRTIQDLSARAVSELESKQKHSWEVVESVQASYALLNSKKMWLEEGIKKLDGNVEFVRGVLKEVEVGKVQSSVMGDLIDTQLKELALKEKQIQHLFEALKLTPRDEEERKNVIDLMEKDLHRRKDEMDSRQKQLEAKELEACTEQQMLRKKQQEMVAEKKRLECELESRKASLVEQESLIASKERTLVERESDFARKQKIWESELESRKAYPVKRESLIVSKELDAEQKLKKMQQEMNDEQKRLECELESRKVSLVERESLITSKERTLQEIGNELVLKQKLIESELESRKASLVERESMIISKELDVELKGRLLEKRENLMQSKAMRDFRENIIQPPESCTITKSPPRICMEGNRRGFGDGSAGEDMTMDSQRRGGKRQCSGDGVTGHIEARAHLQQSGLNDKFKTKTEDNVVLDDSESGPEVRTDLVLKDAQKQELVRHLYEGEIWACFDAKDGMPRTYVKILRAIEQGGNVCIQVEWMKPFPRFGAEKDWVSAGLPVGCGTFEPLRKSVENPRILFQPISRDGNPYIIVPFIGETWAIYKDWDFKKWSSHPAIHKRCEYELVEILPYSRGGSLIVAVRVAYLDKVRGSTCSFQRRSNKEKDSFLIPPNSLYRFSHKVPSSKNSGVFELDQNALPPGLC